MRARKRGRLARRKTGARVTQSMPVVVAAILAALVVPGTLAAAAAPSEVDLWAPAQPTAPASQFAHGRGERLVGLPAAPTITVTTTVCPQSNPAPSGTSSTPDGSNVPATPDSTSGAPSPDDRSSGGRNESTEPSANPWLIVAAALVSVALAGVLGFFLVIQPRGKRRRLDEALAIVRRDDTPRFEQAEDGLRGALESGLRSADLADARFARAYLLARLGRFREAAGVASDLLRSGSPDQESVYLALWLASKVEDHGSVLEIFEAHSQQLGDLLDAKLIASISLLHSARIAWQRRDIEASRRYYEKLKDLGVLTDRVPSYIDDHQLMLGTVALFEKNFEEARVHFDGSMSGARQAGRSTLVAELGLLLVRWGSEGSPSVEQDLAETVERLCQEHPEAVVAPKGAEGDEMPLSEDRLLVRGALMWLAMSLLREWAARPRKSGIPPESLDELTRRLDRVRASDPTMSDPWLVEGLLRYYAASDDSRRRSQAVDLLQASVDRGVNLPEVLELIRRERQNQEAASHALEHYLTLVATYIADPGVPLHLREELRRRLSRFDAFREAVELDLRAGDAESAPSLEDVQARGKLLQSRIEVILRDRLAGQTQAKGVEEMLRQLQAHTAELTAAKEAVDTTSTDLMGTAGEFLLHDEGVEAAPGAGHQPDESAPGRGYRHQRLAPDSDESGPNDPSED